MNTERTPRSRTVAVSIAAAVLALAPLAAGPFASSAEAAGGQPAAGGSLTSAPTGWVRVAHLAPGVAAMDVYLANMAGGSSTVFRHAGYGSFTGYQTLKPGNYALAMRPAGSPASTAPVASWRVAVGAGKAYTVAAFGRPGHLSSEVFADALVEPAAGDARVRLIQGAPAAAKVTITAVDGPLLAQNVPYGSVTNYADVPQGHWTLAVTEDNKSVVTAVNVAAGGVYSLVVLQRADGSLKLDTGVDVGGQPVRATGMGKAPVSMNVKVDAAAAVRAPKGSVNTGEGGTAGSPTGPAALTGGNGVEWSGAAVLAVLAGGGVLRRRAHRSR